MRIAVTGAAGYIGGQTVLNLLDRGHEVLAIDNQQLPDHLQQAANIRLTVNCDFASEDSLAALDCFGTDCVIHCAGTSLVGPSIANPNEYYENNFVKTKRLLDHLRGSPIRLVFSSSAAVYGEPVMVPCSEVDPVMPISPYGESKAMIEWMLAGYARAYGLDYVAFRYFNACGADSQTRHGQAPGATHIIARVLESLRDDTEFHLYGNQYPTPDGTCVRDYVHVQDLAEAHVQAAEGLCKAGVYNLGTGSGISNQQVMNMAQQVTGRQLRLAVHKSRDGDPASLTADAGKFTRATGWKPQFGLEQIVKHAWAWYTR